MSREPISTPAAFRVLFAAPYIGAANEAAHLTFWADRRQLGQILQRLGTPSYSTWRGDTRDMPSVAIAPCALPLHPQTDGEVIGAAFIAALTCMLKSGELPLVPGIAEAFDRLRETLDDRPIVLRDPEPSAADRGDG